MEWQEKVRHLMDINGIKQRELARRIGVTEYSISRYLNGSRKVGIDNVVRIASALNVMPGYLLSDDGEAERKTYKEIATVIAKNANLLTAEEKNNLIALLLGKACIDSQIGSLLLPRRLNLLIFCVE